MACNAQSLNPAERRALCERYVGMALARAEALLARAPSLRAHRDDVRAAALLGLTEAAATWEPGPGDFSTWAERHIRNRILEYGRRHARVVPLTWSAAFSPPDEKSLDVPTPGGESYGDSEPDTAEPVDVLADLRLNGPRLLAETQGAVQSRLLATWNRDKRRPPAERDAQLFMAKRLRGVHDKVLAAELGLSRAGVSLALQRAQAAFDAWAAEVRGDAEVADMYDVEERSPHARSRKGGAP